MSNIQQATKSVNARVIPVAGLSVISMTQGALPAHVVPRMTDADIHARIRFLQRNGKHEQAEDLLAAVALGMRL